MSNTTRPLGRYAPIRPEWLALRQEPVREPDRVIVDSHHHLWDHPGNRYLLPEFLSDVNTGHRVAGTIYAECGAMHRTDGPAALRPVGEVEFAVKAAEDAAARGLRTICAGIIGGPDLRLGHGVEDVLHAMIEAGKGRFRGVRNTAAWHSDPEVRPASNPPQGLLVDPQVRAGISLLPALGLSFDVWAYHTQFDEVLDLVRSFPDLTIVIDHIGGALGIGPFAGKRADVFPVWSAGLRELARCSNVHVKFGGLGMRITGSTFHERPLPPSSEELAAEWQPYFDVCMDSFGPTRCMFESNFPVDKGMFSYPVLWNAFKRLASGCSDDEKDALLGRTAARVYKLDLGCQN